MGRPARWSRAAAIGAMKKPSSLSAGDRWRASASVKVLIKIDDNAEDYRAEPRRQGRRPPGHIIRGAMLGASSPVIKMVMAIVLATSVDLCRLALA